MKVFVAGATGVVGRRLVPALIEKGHEVTGMTRSPGKAGSLDAAGARPVVADALDGEAVIKAIREAEPEVVVHQLTDLSALGTDRDLDRTLATTNRLRSEGTHNLLAGARAAGSRRLVAQGFAGWPYARTGGPVKSEEDPLDPDPPPKMRRALAAIRDLEQTVTGADPIEGVVLRYAGFYGPGTSLGEGGAQLEAARKRRFPIIGGGGGIWSLVHIDDVIPPTVTAIERAEPGIYNVADDEPAPIAEWLPALAAAIGAKPPLKVPAWVGRLAIGREGVILMTDVRGVSNAKAKRELGLELQWPSWREGFRSGLA